MSYKDEFPNFDYELPYLGKVWEDNSWHNDVCPSLDYPLGGEKVLRIWFDYHDPEMRECGGKRFIVAMGVYGESMEHLFESDDLIEVFKFIKENKLTNLYECFWGDGYRGDDNKSTLAYHDVEFFNEERGYEEGWIDRIKDLQIGQKFSLFDALTGEHWVRRIG